MSPTWPGSASDLHGTCDVPAHDSFSIGIHELAMVGRPQLVDCWAFYVCV